MPAYLERTNLPGIKRMALLKASEQRAMDTVSINISMDGFNEICVRVAGLPDGQRNETMLPAYGWEDETGTELVFEPVWNGSD